LFFPLNYLFWACFSNFLACFHKTTWHHCRAMITPVSPLRSRLIHISPSYYWKIRRSFEIILEWEMSTGLKFISMFYANPLLQNNQTTNVIFDSGHLQHERGRPADMERKYMNVDVTKRARVTQPYSVKCVVAQIYECKARKLAVSNVNRN